MSKRNATRIHFEDHGQDFLWWDLDPMGGDMYKVVGAGPFQSDLWIGQYVLCGVEIGGHVEFSCSPDHEVLRLNYVITKIEPGAKVVPA